jgi:hypothetical protein
VAADDLAGLLAEQRSEAGVGEQDALAVHQHRFVDGLGELVEGRFRRRHRGVPRPQRRGPRVGELCLDLVRVTT